jgi:hypothetical protein
MLRVYFLYRLCRLDLPKERQALKLTGFSVVERQMLTDVETRPQGRQLTLFPRYHLR